MEIFKDANKDKGTPILLPDTKRIWIACFVLGSLPAPVSGAGNEKESGMGHSLPLMARPLGRPTMNWCLL